MEMELADWVAAGSMIFAVVIMAIREMTWFRRK